MLSSREIQARVEAFVWLQWSALGAGGSSSAWPRDVLIDPEVLVCTTAWATDEASRVRASAADWIRSNSGYLSWTRRKSLVVGMDDEGAAALDRIWPKSSALQGPRPARSASRPVPLPDLRDRPDLLALRARAMFGIGARAEILRVMALLPHREWSVLQLASRIGFQKRGVAEALSMLEDGGLVARMAEGNSLRYRLARPAEITELLGPLPEHSRGGPSWPAIMRIQLVLRDVARFHERLDRAVAEVESAAAIDRVHADLIGEWFAGASMEQITPRSDFAGWLEYWTQQVTDASALARHAVDGP